MLHGRSAEMATIDRLLRGARDGTSGALLLRGEAGIGKTALLDHAVAAAADLHVVRGTGIETERQLPFAGLHLLLKSVTGRVGGLPDRQARALGGALGLVAPVEGDRFLVGMGVLTLLADLAEEQPVLCVVDDAQWLDHASAEALLFAARRLQEEGIVMLLAARDVYAPAFPAPGVPELTLANLPREASARLLAKEAADLPAHVREQILHEAGGNPLALLELPAAQREGQLAAEPHGVRAASIFSRMQQTFADRIATLPAATQTLLLVAAADHGDPASVFAAAKLLGADVTDLEPAERQRLLGMSGDALVFRHPLIRTAAYRGATVSRRLAVHRALADVLDGDRRAWHLAAATTGPDEYVAVELERSAESARRRGGHAAVAAAYERAANLSTDHHSRGRRLAAAARAAADAGQFERAAGLADDAADLVADPLVGAEMARIRAGLADERGSATSARQLLAEAADAVAEQAPDLATGLLFAAIETAWSAGDFPAVPTVADQARRLCLPDAARIEQVAVHITGLSAPEGSAAEASRAVRLLFDRDLTSGPIGLRENAKIAWWEVLLGDYVAAHRRAVALERECRAQGAIGVLPRALMLLARTQLWLGAHRDARASASEGARIAQDIGQSRELVFLRAVLAHLCAIEGDEQNCRQLATDMGAHGSAPSQSRATAITALLDLGAGRHEAALEKLLAVVEGTNKLVTVHSLPDLVEAAVRVGRPELGWEAARQYSDWADHSAHPWARAVAARCEALLGGDEETWTRAVPLHHHDADSPFERARTQLLHGEWLRRQHRRIEARTMLRSALQIFERLGAKLWADRSSAELRATGENRSFRTEGADALGRLTSQERQVVQLAAKGHSNRDIGTQLFLSPRTVGYHLYNAYPKLGVSSRGELSALMPTAAPRTES
ncbi:LuxR family transcriptional regulator [Micromonospora sp. KC606]|uniref:helix-turn-helix transcriptional regulator n=1 Tax=Micromonospora sp. KC606 TaxID=2530379 RepID=UPI00105321AC|nr:LuxR family transcriptional regulator [Micromonospora sp. KC606]TDC85936.1 LuxR family transcriptional regulator [Micromonospora sp. KC606]